MKKLLTLTMICVLFGASYAQKTDTVHNVGKDRDGDTWYLDTDLVVTPRPPADWIRVMPIYTRLSGRTLVFMYNVDCSDSTYQFVKAFAMDAAGNTLYEENKRSAWAKFSGYSGNAARIVCRKERQLPLSSGQDGGR
jgi:hypothetical protein